MYDTKFDVAFNELMDIEGYSYSDYNEDRGGATKYGISQRAFPDLNIPELTIEQAKEIYYDHYWLKLHLNKVCNYDLAYEIFEQGVNMGLHRIQVHVQRALNYLETNLVVDGIIGPATIIALNEYLYPQDLLKVLNVLQGFHYISIVENQPSQRKWARGWMRRIK
jgi:lysozyme family protein